MIDSQYAYVAHNNKWKRIALSTWTHCSINKNQVFPIDYFDAYTDDNYLYLCKNNTKRRVAISDWESEGKVPIEASSNLWIDESYIYAKTSGHSNNIGGSSGEYEWIRYAIGEYL
jgi:phosphoserine aminotransferase